jgi:hypothetical protein
MTNSRQSSIADCAAKVEVRHGHCSMTTMSLVFAILSTVRQFLRTLVHVIGAQFGSLWVLAIVAAAAKRLGND